MKEEHYNKLKTLSKLLEEKDIQNIVEEITEGYELNSDEGFVFISKDNDKMTLSLNKENNLIFKRKTNNTLEVQTIEEGPTIIKKTYELRPNGIIITEETKMYNYSKFSLETKCVVDLFSERYVLTKEKINQIYPNIISNGEYDVERLHEIVDMSTLKDNADLITNFETHMKGYGPVEESKKASYMLYTTYTYLNGEDISYIYDIVEGPDKLLRIYDLYNGIVNKRNLSDIFYINIGCMRSEAFYLKEVKGIVAKEDNLVGAGIDTNKPYAKSEALLKKISPSGEVCLDSRETLLESIRIHSRQKLNASDNLDIEMFITNLIRSNIENLKRVSTNIKRKIKIPKKDGVK